MSEVMAQTLLDDLKRMGIPSPRLENDSRRVRAGDVFVAYPGVRTDGRQHIPEAIRRGAAAVLWERSAYAWNPAWLCPHLGVDGLQSVSGYLAHRLLGAPSEQLRLIGITGTNGKTTCACWIAQALTAAGRPCALIGTLGNGFPGSLEGSANTTPDALTLHQLLARYRNVGAHACAMEVSSIGLDQGRCNGAHFDTAVFTNLTHDHLDYHGSMTDYAAAKRRLFERPELRTMVVNLDDPFGAELLDAGSGARRIGYTLDGRSHPACQTRLRVTDIRYDHVGVHFLMHWDDTARPVSAPIVGRYNVANLMAAAGALLAVGFDADRLPDILAHLTPPAGRMQRLGGVGVPLVVVDYAHSPDALLAALNALRPLAEARGGRLVCLFGCGGDRDTGKRPLMGEVAARLADIVWLTSDNPRSEDPTAIIAAIRAGAPAARVEPDRAAAIRAAIGAAAAADVVLVAGKGHETYQEIAGVRQPFSDANVVKQTLAGLPPRGGPAC